MQQHTDRVTAREENAYMQLAVLSVPGDREEQQDCVGYEIRPEEGLITVCDGMGGHNGGKQAASIAVNTVLQRYSQAYPSSDVPALLAEIADEADRRIAALTDENGQALRAGSTTVTVLVRGRSLYWISAGDSRLYLLRDDELVQVTADHIYQTVLDGQLASGQLTAEEYQLRSRQGGALVSFLGVGGLPQTDRNEHPLTLQAGDRLLLTSDGLYKVLSHEEIARLLSNFSNVEEAVGALELKAQRVAKHRQINRDNMTVALIKIM